MSRRLKLLSLQIRHFEYWPWRVFYAPLLLYYAWLSVKYKSMFFPKQVNSFLPDGGFFKEDKEAMLRDINAQFLPQMGIVNTESDLDKISQHIGFPMVCKTNSGQRGNGVELVRNEIELQRFYDICEGEFIAQEFVEWPLELAVFCYKEPGQGQFTVSSVTRKKFLSVTGDGISSIEDLLKRNVRAELILEDLKENSKVDLQQIPEANMEVLVEPIGNHCRGTEFQNVPEADKEKMAKVCSEILRNKEAFYYGRFDLKTTSLEDFYEGKNIKILELNGINADPAHIFDPNYKLFNAWRDVGQHWKVAAKIAAENRNKAK
ncbi:ATP-grasp domain-containing protein [Jiulongibacter sp. NS-SX5]|uniref:ATP-grasp domain-containing protein n=1 Tax=Jiulongibacter sp. NS-SX5 TaxID=3463854 RepID=UPI00405847CE